MVIRTFAKQLLIIAFWLLVWQIAAWAVGNRILLAGPIDSAIALMIDITTLAFWISIGFSLVRIIAGFAIGFAAALACGTIAWKSALFAEVVHPVITFMKSVPVVCIIVLLLVWMGSANVSIVAVAIMVFPPVYFSYLEGLRQIDEDMRQMLHVFDVHRLWRIRYYYIPAVMPYVISAARVVVGISWKSGVAAEVIGIPAGSIGAQIYAAKIGLSCADLFAWTAVVVAASALSEKLFLTFLDSIAAIGTVEPKGIGLKRAGLRRVGSIGSERAGFGSERAGSESLASAAIKNNAAAVAFEDVTFGYGDTPVIVDFTQAFEAGGRYCLMGPSGSGKSTIMDLASGLAEPASGTVVHPERVSRDFQEDRLLTQLSAWGNVALVCPETMQAERALLKFDMDELLGQDSSTLEIDACSGGMKRKIALVRALAAPGGIVLLDEPFAGLDDISRTDVIAFVNRHLKGRTLIVCTHDYDDIKYLAAERIRLS